MSVPITTDSQVEAKLEIYTGISKKTGNPFKCLKLTVGKYNTLVFCSPFELDYLIDQLGE